MPINFYITIRISYECRKKQYFHFKFCALESVSKDFFPHLHPINVKVIRYIHTNEFLIAFLLLLTIDFKGHLLLKWKACLQSFPSRDLDLDFFVMTKRLKRVYFTKLSLNFTILRIDKKIDSSSDMIQYSNIYNLKRNHRNYEYVSTVSAYFNTIVWRTEEKKPVAKSKWLDRVYICRAWLWRWENSRTVLRVRSSLSLSNDSA